jgi:hypothetical protein
MATLGLVIALTIAGVGGVAELAVVWLVICSLRQIGRMPD